MGTSIGVSIDNNRLATPTNYVPIIVTAPATGTIIGSQNVFSGMTTQVTNLSPSTLFNIAVPTAVRAGDVIYWNGSAWVTLAGNNSGTQILAENSSGVPSWSAAGSGSVTSVTCGTGLSGGTFTTTGTCAVSLTTATNSLGADVALNNTANYFDGPSVAQGTVGTWFASGQATVLDTAVANFQCKLWDGTTVIDSSSGTLSTGNGTIDIHLSGFLATPAANIRISCKDITTVNGLIKFNNSGNSKDSTLSAFRIQ